ncbi:MAG: hypothetical protein MR031_03440 [Tenericutes bacterium]|nr:hypothetical protein [Mycoplasmatota bacterium]
MRYDLKNYLTEIDKILSENKIKNKDEILENHLHQISFFQHERFVHLIVTVFVGICTTLFLLFGILLSNIYVLLLFGLTFILFVPYIFHYYFLENGVQKLYHQYWSLKEKEH